jgi:hypothetical protein
MYIPMPTQETKDNAHNQFVYPNSKRSELIVLAPFRAGVIKDNQFTD